MSWQTVKNFPTLPQKKVHIWRANLKQSDDDIAELKKLLNQEELDRAAKFKVKPAADGFIIARAILRKLLGKYLSVSPLDLIFKQNKYGKLQLKNSNLQFNLSHSGELALFIFAYEYPVGIDVEQIRKNFDCIDIANKFFSQTESSALLNLPKTEQLLAFFNCWTRKEAFIKAKGTGMFTELNKFSVEVNSLKTGQLKLMNAQGQSMGKNWMLQAINPGEGYAGAFVVRGLIHVLHQFHY